MGLLVSIGCGASAVVAWPAQCHATEAATDRQRPTVFAPVTNDGEEPVRPPATLRPPREITGWLAGGVGGGDIGDEGATFGRVELSAGIGRHLLSLSYGYSEDANGSCGLAIICFNDVSVPRNSATELALRYGIKARGPAVLATASIGIAAVWGVERGSKLLSQDCFFGCVSYYDSKTFRTVGASAEAGAYLSSRFVSIGPAFIADVNPVRSFWAVILDLHLGFVGSP